MWKESRTILSRKIFNWLKFTLRVGQEGWISDRLVTKVSKVMDESSFVEKVSSIAFINQLQQAIEYLDNPAQNFGETPKLNVDTECQTAAQIINQFGEPALRERQHSLIYHGSSNDFLFYSSYSNLYNKLTIKPVAK